MYGKDVSCHRASLTCTQKWSCDNSKTALNGVKINHLCYTGCTVLLAMLMKDLQKFSDTTIAASKHLGLHVNTKVMVLSKLEVIPSCLFRHENTTIKHVATLNDLGITHLRCPLQERNPKENQLSQGCVYEAPSCPYGSQAKHCSQDCLLKAVVWSFIQYGCECWTSLSETWCNLEAVKLFLLTVAESVISRQGHKWRGPTMGQSWERTHV